MPEEEYIKISRKNWRETLNSVCPEFKNVMRKLAPKECEEEIELESG